MAPFILAFGDLNKHVLRDETSTDPYQKMVNAHSHEDDHHWPWYLDDFALLGFDRATTSTETMRFLFDEDLQVNRMLSAKLAHLIYGATPIERLVIIEAIEETGNVLFALTAKVAREIEAQTGITLRYLGDFHFNLETGHAMGTDDHAQLAAIQLDDAARARCLALVDEASLFEEWTGELLAYARRANARQRPARAVDRRV